MDLTADAHRALLTLGDATSPSNMKIELRDLENDHPLATVASPKDLPIRAVLLPDGRRALFFDASKERLQLTDMMSGRVLSDYGRTPSSLGEPSFALSSDAKTLAVCAGSIKLWDVEFCRLLRTLRGNFKDDCNPFDTQALKFIHGDRLLLVDAKSLWDVASGRRLRCVDQTVKDNGVFLRGRDLIVIGEKRVAFIDIDSGRQLRSGIKPVTGKTHFLPPGGRRAWSLRPSMVARGHTGWSTPAKSSLRAICSWMANG